MRQAGFGRIEAWTTRKGVSVRLPWPLVTSLEAALDRMPRRLVRRIGLSLPLRLVLGCYVVGIKED
jgi:hypothetical protein